MGKNKGKKKQNPQEKVTPSARSSQHPSAPEPSPGSTSDHPPDPQPSTSTGDFASEKTVQRKNDQFLSEESTTQSKKGGARTFKNQPILQEPNQQIQKSYHSPRDESSQQKPGETFRKPDQHFQGKGGRWQQGPSVRGEQQQQWHNKGQGQDKGLQSKYSGGRQSRNPAQQEGRPGGQQIFREKKQSSSQTQQVQPKVKDEFKENVWGKKKIQHKEKEGQQPQSFPKKDFKGGQSKGVEGAPDKVQHLTSSQLSPNLSSNITALIPGPKKPGTLFRKKIKVQSNHFALDLGNLKEAYLYQVTIIDFEKEKQEQSDLPPVDGKDKTNKRRKVKDKIQYRVMRAFLEKHFPGRYPAFDGKGHLYASRPLLTNDVLTDTGITVKDVFEKPRNFSIEVQYLKTLSLELQALGPGKPKVLAQEAIQCIDVVLRNAPTLYFNQIGASFFSKPKDRIINLGGGLEMYHGFYQSVVMGGRPLLNVHLAHKPFAKNKPVLDVFVEILTDRGKHSYTYADLAKLSVNDFKILNSYMKYLKVAYEIPGIQNKVIYKVNELGKLNPHQATLSQNGVQKTVLDYFRLDKKYCIKYPDIPLLSVGSVKSNIKIPPELCVIEKDQYVLRKLEAFQTTNMINHSATSSHEHRNNTMKRFSEARYNDSPCVQEFGFSVNDKFEETDARVLPTPKLQYSKNFASVSKGAWQNGEFLISKTIKKWAIVDVSMNRYINRQINVFIKEMKSAARTCGLDIETEPVFETVSSHSRYGPTKRDLEIFFEKVEPKNYDIIFVIIPSQDRDSNMYSFVKGAAEITAGCLTQCVTEKTVLKFNFMTAKNIMLKVNSKLAGINHTFTSDCKPKILRDKAVMIMGADVTHPGRTENMPSVAAVIASHDPTAFQYNLCLSLQEKNVEDILDLKAIVVKQLKFYYKKNNRTKPEAIIFFRDGVSEGQFLKVLNEELKAIKEACLEVQKDGNYNPAISFYVVQKRHHTRLFPLNDCDSEDQSFKKFDRYKGEEKTIHGNYNVPAGTCVDTNIVNPTMQNFYLVSHGALKGVSRPTKYCTLYDDLDLSNDEIQELAYYLCHMFARCNRSVSYPAPTYYAHLGALRGKAYIKPAVEDGTFQLEELQKEIEKYQTKDNLLNENPMFFV